MSSYFNENGELHRVDGPAIELNDDVKEWLINRNLYREIGPVFEYSNGTKKWYV